MKLALKLAVLMLIIFFNTELSFSQKNDSEVELNTIFSNDIVTVKVYRIAAGSGWKSQILVSDGRKETQVLKLQKWTPSNFSENEKKITHVLNKIGVAGFNLKTSSMTVNDIMCLSEYIFQKEEEK